MKTISSKHLAGWLGENLALFWLYCRGVALLGHDRRGRYAQVDIIAREADVLCLVEVKVRRSRQKAHHALHPVQRQRLARQAAAWQQHYNCQGVRLDAVLIFPHWPFIEHVKDAW